MPSASVPKTSSISFKFMSSSSIVFPKHRTIQKHCTHEWCNTWTNYKNQESNAKMRKQKANIWLRKNEQLGSLRWFQCDVYVISSHIVYDRCLQSKTY
jgi:hypothetical protein